MTSQAMVFIEAAARGAKRWKRQSVHGAVHNAIEHHMRFQAGDVKRCGQLYDWFNGEPLSLYAAAIKIGNDSFCRAFEADRTFAPWLWPGCLCSGWEAHDDRERLYVGRQVWYIHKGEMRLWKVTSMWATELTICLIQEREHWPKCKACKREKYEGQLKPAKVLARVIFTRESFGELTGRLDGYRKAGILDVDGIVTWDVQSVADVQEGERAWKGTFASTRGTKYGHGRISTGFLVEFRDLLVHGETLDAARESCLLRLDQLAHTWIDTYRNGHNGLGPIGFDQEVAVAEIDFYDLHGCKIPSLRARCKGRQTVTPRQLLRGVRDFHAAASELTYRLRNVGRAERQARSDAEYKERVERERAELLARYQAHADVPVTIADSLEAGNCAQGTINWLSQFFPEALKGIDLTQTDERLTKVLLKVKRHLTVGQILEVPEAIGWYHARLAMDQAIARAAKE